MYCLARASTLHQQELAAAVVRPSRVHELLVDLAGTRSMFNRTFHSLMTMFARLYSNDWIDHLWDNDRPDEHVVVGENPEEDPPFSESVKACVDIWLGPVRAGECDHPDEFKGLMIRAEHWGEEITATRPDLASNRTSLPEEVTFTPMPPPGADHLTLAQKKAYAEAELAKALPEARRQGQQSRPPVRRRRKKRRARSNFRGVPRGVRRALTEYSAWLRFYDQCRRLFKVDQTVVFPVGTVAFRRLGANCDPQNITRCL